MAFSTDTSNPVFTHSPGIAQTVVLVDGIARSGKSIIAPIISSFDRVEILRVDETLDITSSLYAMGQISRDATIAMLRMKIDINLYNGLIGRDSNLRFGDYSSIWKNSNLLRSLKRLKSKEGAPVLETVENDRPIYQQTTHDQLGNIDLFIAAFGDGFKNIQMIRHPADMISSWMRRNWGNRIGTDPLAFTLTIYHQGQDLPFYAHGWEDAYIAATPAGRVVRAIEQVWDRNQSVYQSLDETQRQQVFFISFEDFVKRPDAHIQPLADFLGSATTRRTPGAIKRENCPRTLDSDIFQTIRSVENQVSIDESAIMHRMIGEYERLAAENAR
jgi:hypothetical protein